MKICLFGITGVPLGKHNGKDPRLDEADRLVEAKKKVYVQVDLADDKGLATADVIAASQDGRPDLILQDLDFVETRLGRNPAEPEGAALLKLKDKLEQDGFVADAV